MQIKEIKLVDCSVSESSGTHYATVLLNGQDSTHCMRASAFPDVPDAPARITLALVQDAIRQLRRMPEYRSGANVITIADTAWPNTGDQA